MIMNESIFNYSVTYIILTYENVRFTYESEKIVAERWNVRKIDSFLVEYKWGSS